MNKMDREMEEITFENVLDEWKEEFGNKYYIKNKNEIEQKFKSLLEKYPGQTAFWYADSLMSGDF